MNEWEKMSESELLRYSRSESLEERGKALELLGVRYASRGQLTVAKAYFEQSIEVNEQVNNAEWVASSQQLLGRVLVDLDQLDEGIDMLEKALNGFQTMMLDRGVAETLWHRALAFAHLGAFDYANRDVQSAADIYSEFGDKRKLAKLLADRAGWESKNANYEVAQQLLLEAAILLEKNSDFIERLSIQVDLIELATLLHQPADEWVEKARQLDKVNSEDLRGEIIDSWEVRNFIVTGRLADAERALNNLEHFYPSSEGKMQRVAVLRSMIADATHREIPGEDIDELKTAYLIGASHEDSSWLPLSTRFLALHACRQGDLEAGLSYVQNTLGNFGESFPVGAVFDLTLLESDILASQGCWQSASQRISELRIPHTPEYLDNVALLLKITINHNLAIGAPIGETLHRLNIAAAHSWRFSFGPIPGLENCICDTCDETIAYPVPLWLRKWALEKAASLPEFSNQRVDLLTRAGILNYNHPDIPEPDFLGSASYWIEETIWTPYRPEGGIYARFGEEEIDEDESFADEHYREQGIQ